MINFLVGYVFGLCLTWVTLWCIGVFTMRDNSEDIEEEVYGEAEE